MKAEQSAPDQGAPHVVIIGGGFGGLTCAQELRGAKARVTIVDERNFHLFQPLLYQVATAALSPADIAMPIRKILWRRRNVRVVLGRVEAIDRAARLVHLAGNERPLRYDHLVVATGARHSYFGNDAWEPFAPGLKTIEDALAIRHRVLVAFERAEVAETQEERRRLLTFVVIGGGPTGVEMAGAIAELARLELTGEFRDFDAKDARIVLVEAGPLILPSFPPPLSEKARRSLQHLGVEVLTGTKVETCDADGIVASGQRLEARTLVWAAGVAASGAADWLGAEADRAGRVRVAPDLSLPGDPNVFVIGDTALVLGQDGKPVPGIAPAAKQEGAYVARLLERRLGGAPPPPPFRYHHAGDLATIGRSSAVMDFGRIRLSGLVAWLLWGGVHIFFLIGFRNRVIVLLGWLWSYFTGERGARLITGTGQEL
ncbi:MAG: NAD(P)/FAD-dependent oxidoreductase [Acetobacteraceae bacterium]|nr:NAD(P)/FAD-dependent oxidoreductase [Acetobacteraceae bacterium]